MAAERGGGGDSVRRGRDGVRSGRGGECQAASELDSCWCHGLPGELPLWVAAALPRARRILDAEPISRSFLI